MDSEKMTPSHHHNCSCHHFLLSMFTSVPLIVICPPIRNSLTLFDERCLLPPGAWVNSCYLTLGEDTSPMILRREGRLKFTFSSMPLPFFSQRFPILASVHHQWISLICSRLIFIRRRTHQLFHHELSCPIMYHGKHHTQRELSMNDGCCCQHR